jgi:cyclic-di-GMP-binding protein
LSALPLSRRRAAAERLAPPRELEIRPKQVKAWLESLPLAKSLEASAMLSGHVASLNRAKLDVDDRIQILESYRAVASTVLEELEAIYGKAALPLTARARDALSAARHLAYELASGYMIAVEEKAGKRIAFGAKKQLPILMLRAMEYLGAELRASYKSYSPAPAGIWHEMHQLYLYAEKEGIAAETADAERSTTVIDAYSESLLLSLTDPYRLVHGEADRILAQIRGLRGLVTLGQARPATRSGGHFLVPCDTDRPPKPALSANDETGGANWRLLDANALVDKLRLRKHAHESGNVSQTASRSVGPDVLALMGRLALLWGDPPKRAYRRDPMDTTVAICVGLKAISHFVSLEPNADIAKEGERIRSGITLPLLAMPDEDASKGIPVYEWDVVNQSEGGLKVRRASNALQMLVVGEAVGIKLVGRARWTIGVTRWITQLDDGAMEFGVQFLDGAASAVWVQHAQSGSPQMKPGLILSAADGARSLLTVPNMYIDLRVFELEERGEASSVRATGLVEKTARFDLFNVAEG